MRPTCIKECRPTVASLAVLILALVCAVFGPSIAANAERPAGPVILTMAGDIGHANRPPFDEASDLLFKYHDLSFQKAIEFDLAALERLGMHEVSVQVEEGAPKHVVSGPRLVDVLKAVGALGKPLLAMALDGYAVEMTPKDVEAYDWIVGLKQDGEYLRLGQRGPIWIVYGRDNGELTWPWAVFFIKVGE